MEADLDLKDRLVRKVRVASQVHLVLVVDLVDILAVDRVAHRFPRQENLAQVRHSHRRVLQSQIVSTCRRGLDNHEIKRSSRYLTTTPTVVNVNTNSFIRVI